MHLQNIVNSSIQLQKLAIRQQLDRLENFNPNSISYSQSQAIASAYVAFMLHAFKDQFNHQIAQQNQSQPQQFVPLVEAI